MKILDESELRETSGALFLGLGRRSACSLGGGDRKFALSGIGNRRGDSSKERGEKSTVACPRRLRGGISKKQGLAQPILLRKRSNSYYRFSLEREGPCPRGSNDD